jgi:FAD/FMN-containing dehydrogenase
VQIQNAAEVIAALDVVTHAQTKFAVRSRGHNPNPGFSSVDQTGVLLDLRDMNTVAVNDDASVVSAEPGASWGDVYGFLEPYNCSAVGGRHADVGVAGLLLGGECWSTHQFSARQC